MTNFEKYFPGRTIDEFKGMTGLSTNNKIRDCDHCPAEKMCAADKIWSEVESKCQAKAEEYK